MCDEYPHLNPGFRGALPYDDVIEAGMVLCVESYRGAVGERDSVELEQQVVVTKDGYELLTTFSYEELLIQTPAVFAYSACVIDPRREER